jgi:hypothetical protein
MGIQQICNSIKNLFTGTRPPFPSLPGILIVCSMIKRPGLSAIQSTSNIVNSISKLGIPTGIMPDGSANLTVGFTFASTQEYQRMIKEDLNSQGAMQPGSENILAGPYPGTNVTTGKIMIVHN